MAIGSRQISYHLIRLGSCRSLRKSAEAQLQLLAAARQVVHHQKAGSSAAVPGWGQFPPGQRLDCGCALLATSDHIRLQTPRPLGGHASGAEGRMRHDTHRLALSRSADASAQRSAGASQLDGVTSALVGQARNAHECGTGQEAPKIHHVPRMPATLGCTRLQQAQICPAMLDIIPSQVL